MKRTLTKDQEFDILKIVLDKLMLLGVIIIGYGLYTMVEVRGTWYGLAIIASGAILILLFMLLLVLEFEYAE
jgi:hypothetical protein